MLLLPILIFLLDIFFSANCFLPVGRGYPAPSQSKPPSSAESEEYFEQKLDHFTETDSRTWKQVPINEIKSALSYLMKMGQAKIASRKIFMGKYWRYFTESSFYSHGGPAYLWIGAEGPIFAQRLEGFYWTEHGKTNKAIIFNLEHRFYGASQPLGDLSVENLRYLTVAQVLADTAAFISGMNAKYKLPGDTKWIVVGVSYGGMLAAWMRVKYPDLVHGAIASSAPVVVKVEIPEYFDATVETLAAYNKECTDDLAKANKELETKLQTPEGRKEIGKVFKLCGPLTGKKLDNSFFLYFNVAINFGDTLQYVQSEKDVQDICNIMLEGADKLSPMERYANVMKMFMKEYEETCLFTSFEDYLTIYTSTESYDSEAKDFLRNRQWEYQQCTELGQFQTVGPNNTVFSKLITSEIYEGWCMGAFGKSFNKALTSKGVDSINHSYGGASINTPRIVFANGRLDPWRALSITSKDKNPNVDVIVIKGMGHGTDIWISSESDPKELKEAQKQLASLVDGWLKQPK